LDRLEAVGYRRDGRDLMVEDLVAPRWPDGEKRHHLYLVIEGSDRNRERTAFRDFLRSHAEQAKRYGDLKRRLARDHSRDWDAYAEGKSAMVAQLLCDALERQTAEG